MAKNVRFIQTTKAKYLAREVYDELALYFCVDTNELYKGSSVYTDGIRIIETKADLPECSCAADGTVYYIRETRNGYTLSPDRTEWLQTIYAPVTDAYVVPESEIYNTVTTVGAVRDIEAKIYERIEKVASEGESFTAGDGIEIVNGEIYVRLADISHGLTMNDGKLVLNLATEDTDGAMSKEDKKTISSIPYMYEAHKYDISGIPTGTLVKYSDGEIRVMCPANAVWTKQTVGDGGDANSYYMTFKTYVPNDDIVGYIEHLGDQVDSEILTTFSTDKYGRRYQPTWLALAKYDEATDTWTYYGKTSTTDKYIGWDYQIDWYNADGVVIASDCVRINLSNEECHSAIKPYYGVSTTEEIEASVEEVVEDKMETKVEEAITASNTYTDEKIAEIEEAASYTITEF
jgi:hypothetical protein